jgi:hypothetical protein
MSEEQIHECVTIKPRDAGMCEKCPQASMWIDVGILDNCRCDDSGDEDEYICESDTVSMICEEENGLQDQEELEWIGNIVHKSRYIAEFGHKRNL